MNDPAPLSFYTNAQPIEVSDSALKEYCERMGSTVLITE